MSAISLATKGVLCFGDKIRLVYVEKVDVEVMVDQPLIDVDVDDVKLGVDVYDVKIDITVQNP